jgi:hypothetical protein
MKISRINKKKYKTHKIHRKKYTIRKIKSHQGGSSIATEQQKQDWESGIKDLNQMTKEDLAQIKNQYENQVNSIGNTFKNFKMSVGNSEPVRPSPVPPECIIL